jgi:uncharacterized LabA/DUF88 family protein
MLEAPPPQSVRPTRVMVFVDYWNFQLTINGREASQPGTTVDRFKVNWRDLGVWLATKAASVLHASEPHSFEGVSFYTSYDPMKEEGRKFHRWAMGWLNAQPGVRVECRERRRKALPRCPACYAEIAQCPHCLQKIQGTVEKGVDTLMATDMIRLAWEDAYDLAVVASSDADLVPAVEFLRLKARKVIQAGFPPLGAALATACWASFDVFRDREEIRRQV